MSTSSLANTILFVLCTLFHLCHNLDYSDLEAMGVSCPEQDKCSEHRNNTNYTQRSCECDRDCVTYRDCCIDYRRRHQMARVVNRLTCINIGGNFHTGVYAIANCSNSWRGSEQVRQKCEGPDDYSDPLLAAPVTSSAPATTYRNRYCAECNNAVMTSLKIFHIKLACNGLHDITQEQLLADITYNRNYQSWGVYRVNASNVSTFYSCDIFFDAPPYLNNSMRFCRSNVISTCDPLWTRQTIRRHCGEYMAVVYDATNAYRNAHCALCNFKSVDDLICFTDLHSRKRPMSFALLLDVNQSDGDQVGMTRVTTPECPSNHIYDPFFKRCKRLACAIPGTVLVNGKCVRS